MSENLLSFGDIVLSDSSSEVFLVLQRLQDEAETYSLMPIDSKDEPVITGTPVSRPVEELRFICRVSRASMTVEQWLSGSTGN